MYTQRYLLFIGIIMVNLSQSATELATFAGGCFWCMQPSFQALQGVERVMVGYAGGEGESPNYQNYAQKGYVEALQIMYNPVLITYENLLDIFWQQINPTDSEGQFVDRGKEYRSIVFYHTPEQKENAIASKIALEGARIFDTKPIVTEIVPFTTFYPAEAYHQNYAEKNPIKYSFYRFKSGRDQFLKKIWNKEKQKNILPLDKLSDQELRARLTPIQYAVTQKNATEPAFKNEFYANQAAGIYVDIVSKEPLFSSFDKFDSQTGWPSFTKPLEAGNIVQKIDKGWFSTRIEVRSKGADSHLGHVFSDGPPPTGLRYCINSAALRFIPYQDLEKEGFAQYKNLFDTKK